MKKKEKIIIRFLLISAIGLWSILAWTFYEDVLRYGPGSMKDFVRVPGENSTQTNLSASPISNSPDSYNQANLEPVSSPTEQPAYCGGPARMTLLAIGSDTRAQTYLYGLADVIRYIRIDFVTPKISVLEFPRDLWVEIPGIEDHYGITHGKLNQSYFYGNPGMGYYTGANEGPGLLIKTLGLNFGANPDHYAAVNMQTFVRMVDTIGGIDINLPFSVDARKPDQTVRKDLYFAPGYHHLNGEQTLMLGRIREYSVFARADQQNRILCALKNEVLSPAILPKVPELIDHFINAVQTDLSIEDVTQLACLTAFIKPENIIFTTFPRELLTEARTYDIGVKKDVYIFKADFQTLRQYVRSFDNGTWPVTTPNTTTFETPRPRGEGTFSCP
ncbi:MAG: LCP family protein [Chloroflexota bacterium]